MSVHSSKPWRQSERISWWMARSARTPITQCDNFSSGRAFSSTVSSAQLPALRSGCSAWPTRSFLLFHTELKCTCWFLAFLKQLKGVALGGINQSPYAFKLNTSRRLDAGECRFTRTIGVIAVLARVIRICRAIAMVRCQNRASLQADREQYLVTVS